MTLSDVSDDRAVGFSHLRPGKRENPLSVLTRVA